MGDKRSPPRVCDTPQQPFYQCGASDWQQGLQQAYEDAQVSPARLICNNGTSATILWFVCFFFLRFDFSIVYAVNTRVWQRSSGRNRSR
jgi:hypothetical protein